MSKYQDLICLLKALRLISEAHIKIQCDYINSITKSTTFKQIVKNGPGTLSNNVLPKDFGELANNIKDGVERMNVVVQGLKVYADLSTGNVRNTSTVQNPLNLNQVNNESILHPQTEHPIPNFVLTSSSFSTPANLTKSSPPPPSSTSVAQSSTILPEYEIKLTKSDRDLIRKLDMEHRAKLVKQLDQKNLLQENKEKTTGEKTVGETIMEKNKQKIATASNRKAKLELSKDAKQQKVPSSTAGRMWSFGTLAAGLSVGTAYEYLKRAVTFDETPEGTKLVFNEANLKRISDTLCKVRGAALKLGQILSIQDESVVSPELAKALERVRKSADFMPDRQVNQVMSAELGEDWQKKFASFNMRPFAAASIGQVHYGKLHDGREVAIKIQYPGVDRAIENDIDMLGKIMTMWDVFPKGMFLDNLMAVAKRELAWEVDYQREAECTNKFKEILNNYDNYHVPYVAAELSTRRVLTTELLDGVPVDQCLDMDYSKREFIGEQVMQLCLMEILRFNYMQTDPNWANFLYSPNQNKLLLLDFGATREYSKPFMNKYVKILKAACDNDKQVVLEMSREIGFLTGYESKIMEDAHVDAVMMLGEIFRTDGKYDFSQQNLTARIQNLAQTMLLHRLCPPPEEIYSLHRKISGIFLLLSKLKVKVNCREKFLSLYDEYMKQNPQIE